MTRTYTKMLIVVAIVGSAGLAQAQEYFPSYPSQTVNVYQDHQGRQHWTGYRPGPQPAVCGNDLHRNFPTLRSRQLMPPGHQPVPHAGQYPRYGLTGNLPRGGVQPSRPGNIGFSFGHAVGGGAQHGQAIGPAGGVVGGNFNAGVGGNIGVDPRTGQVTGEVKAGVQGMLEGQLGGLGTIIGERIGGGKEVGIKF